MKENPIIHRQLELQVLDLPHEASLKALFCNKRILEPLGFQAGFSRAWVEPMIYEHLWSMFAQEEMHWIVIVNNEVVGGIGFVSINLTNTPVELYFWTGQPFWGRGYATLAVTKALDIGESLINSGWIVAHCESSNQGSRRVLLRNGFQFTGIIERTISNQTVLLERYAYKQ